MLAFCTRITKMKDLEAEPGPELLCHQDLEVSTAWVDLARAVGRVYDPQTATKPAEYRPKSFVCMDSQL